MPEEKIKRRPPGSGPGDQQDKTSKKVPKDDELDDLIDDAEEIIRRNKENAQKKQPSRQ